MSLFKANQCRLCKSYFCCQKCRFRHEEDEHGVSVNCDICNYGKINSASLSNKDIFAHIALAHLPLHCLYCKVVFEDLKEIVHKCPGLLQSVEKQNVFKMPKDLSDQKTPKESVNTNDTKNTMQTPAATPIRIILTESPYESPPVMFPFTSTATTSTPMQQLIENKDMIVDAITPVESEEKNKEMLNKANETYSTNSIIKSSNKEVRIKRVTFCETSIMESTRKSDNFNREGNKEEESKLEKSNSELWESAMSITESESLMRQIMQSDIMVETIDSITERKLLESDCSVSINSSVKSLNNVSNCSNGVKLSNEVKSSTDVISSNDVAISSNDVEICSNDVKSFTEDIVTNNITSSTKPNLCDDGIGSNAVSTTTVEECDNIYDSNNMDFTCIDILNQDIFQESSQDILKQSHNYISSSSQNCNENQGDGLKISPENPMLSQETPVLSRENLILPRENPILSRENLDISREKPQENTAEKCLEKLESTPEELQKSSSDTDTASESEEPERSKKSLRSKKSMWSSLSSLMMNMVHGLYNSGDNSTVELSKTDSDPDESQPKKPRVTSKRLIKLGSKSDQFEEYKLKKDKMMESIPRTFTKSVEDQLSHKRLYPEDGHDCDDLPQCKKIKLLDVAGRRPIRPNVRSSCCQCLIGKPITFDKATQTDPSDIL